MSLKAFHILFIAVTTLLAFGLAAWLSHNYAQSGNARDLGLALVSGAAGIALLIYGRYFLKKLKNISYL